MKSFKGFLNGVALLERGGKNYFLEFLSSTAFRLYEGERSHSFALKEDYEPYRKVTKEEGEGYKAFITDDLTVKAFDDGHIEADYKGKTVLQEKPYSSKEPYKVGFCLSSNRPVYGLGDKTGPLDKRDYDYINWNTDDPHPHVDNTVSLYKSIPFFLLFDPACTVGVFFDNTFRSHFDFNKENPDIVKAEAVDGTFDFYFFFGTLPNALGEYTRLVGANPLPPRWALGAQQSRWSYGNKESVESVIEGYQNANIPLSVVYLDIDYMDSYKDFTVDERKFPKIDAWLASLKEKGIHIVPIIDAGVKAEEGYFLYDEGVSIKAFSTLNGEIYHNEVWPGDSVFPSFASPITLLWWSEHVADFLDKGFSGIWNDMNEPASFKGPLPEEVDMGGKLHSEIHNVYGHLMCSATKLGFEKAKKRPFLLTRAAYAGTSRYSYVWTGDNQSTYDHVRLSLPQICGLSLSGVAMSGVDLGGFNGDCTGELLVRFAQANLFSGIFRDHSACDTRSQEPYAFDEATARRYRDVVLTRYELIPTLYDALFMHERAGTAVVRPLIYNFPNDANVTNENTETMLGENLLLAPALFPGQRKREVYFPDVFFHYRSGKRFEKGYAIIDCDLDEIPLFVRQGALVPLAEQGTKTPEFQDSLRLLWTGGKAYAYHYEDAGDGLSYQNGEYNLYLFEIDEEGQLAITLLHEGYVGRYKKIFVERLDESIDD